MAYPYKPINLKKKNYCFIHDGGKLGCDQTFWSGQSVQFSHDNNDHIMGWFDNT